MWLDPRGRESWEAGGRRGPLRGASVNHAEEPGFPGKRMYHAELTPQFLGRPTSGLPNSNPHPQYCPWLFPDPHHS